MALRVWLPLNGNLNNQGLSDLTFSNTNTTNLTINNAGKTGSCYQRAIKQTAGYITSDKTILLDNNITMCCWALASDGIASANGLITNHNHSTNTGVGLTFKYISSTDFRVSCNTGTGSGRTYDTYYGTTNIKDAWHHLALTYDKTAKQLLLYVDGTIEYTLNNYTNAAQADYFRLFEWSTNYDNTNYRPAVKLNDVRIYDDCLSQKQIKEISKGLVAHYKLSAPNINNNLAVDNPLINSGATSISYDRYTRTYTIVSPVGDSTWGYGLNIGSTNKCLVPWDTAYRFSFEVWVPTEHEIRVDYNNYANTGSSWNGNDNDLTSARYQDYVRTVPGQTWTKLIFGSKNANTGNTDHVDIYEVSKIGLRTMNDTEPVTWYLRNFKFELSDTVTDFVTHDYNSLESIGEDCSGNGYHLTVNGTQTYNPDSARYSGSIKMGGTNTDYLRGPILDFLKSPFTFNCWIYQTSATSTSSGNTGNTLQFVMGQGRDCGHAGFALCSANGYARLYLGSDTSGTYWGITDDTISLLNGWHMLTGTFDGANAKLYVDGNLKKTQASTVDPAWTDTGGFVIGKMSYSYTNTAAYFPFVGSVSDAKVYTTALSAEDIKELYQTSAWVDNRQNIMAYEFKEV